MCECKNDIEKRLKARVADEQPRAEDINVELGNYSFFLGASVSLKPTTPIKITYSAPKASGGGTKKVTEKLSMVASFCPFCGESLREPVAAEG